MLQYLIVLLDEQSTSFCSYAPSPSSNGNGSHHAIPLETLHKGIRFAMMENLMIQFVYPDYELPQEYKDEIETIDHSKIVSSLCEDKSLADEADVVVFHDWMGL